MTCSLVMKRLLLHEPRNIYNLAARSFIHPCRSFKSAFGCNIVSPSAIMRRKRLVFETHVRSIRPAGILYDFLLRSPSPCLGEVRVQSVLEKMRNILADIWQKLNQFYQLVFFPLQSVNSRLTLKPCALAPPATYKFGWSGCCAIRKFASGVLVTREIP